MKKEPLDKDPVFGIDIQIAEKVAFTYLYHDQRFVSGQINGFNKTQKYLYIFVTDHSFVRDQKRLMVFDIDHITNFKILRS